MKLDIDKAQAMSLNIENESREFEAWWESNGKFNSGPKKNCLNAWLAAKLAARNAGLSQEPVGDSLRHAAQVIELYDDATMQGDYMLSSTDCAGIIEALVEYHARFTAPPAPVSAEPTITRELLTDLAEQCCAAATSKDAHK